MLQIAMLALLVSSYAGAASLTDAQAEAVRQAREGLYINVLSQSSGDIVMLAGEAHSKTRRNHDLGVMLSRAFGNCGLESEDGGQLSALMR